MKKILLNIQWMIIILLGLYILFLQQCTNNDPIYLPSDTTIVTKTITHIDTVYETDTVTINKTHPPKIIYRDKDLTTYSTAFKDSLIEGEIISSVKGELISSQLKYKPLFPKYIKRTDSIFTTKYIDKEIEKKYFAIFLGAEIGGNTNTFMLSPKISIKTKNDNIYGLRYNRDFNLDINYYFVTFEKKLKFKR